MRLGRRVSAARDGSPAASSASSPTIICDELRVVDVPHVDRALGAPSRSTVARSASWKISFRRCET